MEVDEKLIKHVAEVARLKLTDKEVKRFVPELKEIMKNFEKLQEADTKNTKPSFQPIIIRNSLREDEIKESLSQEEALKNSAHTKEGYFKGPGAL